MLTSATAADTSLVGDKTGRWRVVGSVLTIRWQSLWIWWIRWTQGWPQPQPQYQCLKLDVRLDNRYNKEKIDIRIPDNAHTNMTVTNHQFPVTTLTLHAKKNWTAEAMIPVIAGSVPKTSQKGVWEPGGQILRRKTYSNWLFQGPRHWLFRGG